MQDCIVRRPVAPAVQPSKENLEMHDFGVSLELLLRGLGLRLVWDRQQYIEKWTTCVRKQSNVYNRDIYMSYERVVYCNPLYDKQRNKTQPKK